MVITEMNQSRSKALCITLRLENTDVDRCEAHLEELVSLVTTADIDVVDSLIVPLRGINPSTMFGSGKVEEIASLIEELKVDILVIDQDVPPRVQRNLEKRYEIAVVDRQEIILQIFSDRAMTKEATLQVALARQEYSLPRLTRRWTHLSRQRGGMRGTRDAGETQLEMDRRMVLTKINSLKQELKKVVMQRETQRKNRLSNPIPTVAIVGYTNAGKSSLLNLLSQSDVLVEDKLFATLDPTTRKITLPHGKEVLFSDTVGFVRNLPHKLVEAFSSTLEETRYADIILHIVDASHPDMIHCYETTKEVLASLDSHEKPTLLFINKMDKVYEPLEVAHLEAEHTYTLKGSILHNEGIDTLLEMIDQLIVENLFSYWYLFPYARGDLVARLRSEGSITHMSYTDDGIEVEAFTPEHLKHLLEPFHFLHTNSNNQKKELPQKL